MESERSIIEDLKQSMELTINHAKNEFAKLRAGKAMPSMLDSVMVEYYGAMINLNQIASVNTPDARTIVVAPFEKTMIFTIEKSIINSNLGFNPQNDGVVIIISVPPLTQERRLQIVKNAKSEAEQAKIGVRNNRKEANEFVKKLQKDGDISEDTMKSNELEIQKITDLYIKKVEDLLMDKEKEIMTV